ncbi:MAG: DUF1566 domain-containing protein [Candidatus Scalindua sp.]|nr:DUF1566 domain-containing protein [Candidatus Scalindua sp.]
MTDEKETDNLEIEKIKDRGRVIKISITVLFVCFIIACTSKILEKRQLDKRLFLNEADHKVQQESNRVKQEAVNSGTAVVQPQAEPVPLPDKAELYLTYQEAQKFLDGYKPRNYIDNKFEGKLMNGAEVVIDQATGLMWQQSGSDEKMKYKQTKRYLNNLNREQFAGYSDWRLPTLNESASLLESTKMHGDLYINPVFNKKQSLVWTSDLINSWLGWVTHFSGGSCSISNFEDALYVRAVR